MDNIKNIITGGVITLFIGGTAFTFSQQDVIDNFADDSGLTQEQAEQYVQDISEDELVPWDEIGNDFLGESKKSLAIAAEIDCENYEYEWESPTLPCSAGKAQLQKIAKSEQLLGQSLIQLSTETASEDDMRTTIGYFDQLNTDYKLEIAGAIFDTAAIDDMVMTNTYNKSLLKAALESA